LVNKNFVKSLIKNQGDFLGLENDFEVPISRQKKDWVKKKLTIN
jgi:DNA-binding LytR/AlgR family response regulator